jgi:hypothetical protein
MDKFENHIKQKLQGFEAEPPGDLWPGIAERLDKGSGRRFIWYKVAAALAFLLIAVYSVWFILPHTGDSESLVVIDTQAEINENILLQDQAGESIIPEELPGSVSVLNKQESIDATYFASTEIIPDDLIAYSEDFSGTVSDLQIFEPSVELAMIQPYTTVHFNVGGEVPINISAGRKEAISENVSSYSVPLISSTDATFASYTPERVSGFSISAYLAPNESYRYQSRSAVIPHESMESGLLNIGGGLNLHYRFNKRFEIQSGIAYSRWGQKVHDITVYSHPSKTPLYTFNGLPTSRHPQSMITSMGSILFTNQSYYYADVASSRVLTLKGTYDDSNVRLLGKSGSGLVQQFEFLEIPLMFRYKFIDRGFFIAAKAGASANILRSGKVLLNETGSNTVIGNIVDVITYNFAGSGGLVFGYPITNKVNLLLEPTASVFINPLGVNTSLSGKTYPYNYSLFVGISYDF